VTDGPIIAEVMTKGDRMGAYRFRGGARGVHERRRSAVVAICAAIVAMVVGLTASAVRADSLDAPTGPVLLTVTGNIQHRNGPDGAAFDRAQLEALGVVAVVTETHFHLGPQEFEGVPLKAVLDHVGAAGETLRAQALDGYDVDIPYSDAADFDVLLALRWNGEVMRPRNKGPIWIIYPLRAHPETNNEIYSARSVWQLETLIVE